MNFKVAIRMEWAPTASVAATVGNDDAPRARESRCAFKGRCVSRAISARPAVPGGTHTSQPAGFARAIGGLRPSKRMKHRPPVSVTLDPCRACDISDRISQEPGDRAAVVLVLVAGGGGA